MSKDDTKIQCVDFFMAFVMCKETSGRKHFFEVFMYNFRSEKTNLEIFTRTIDF